MELNCVFPDEMNRRADPNTKGHVTWTCCPPCEVRAVSLEFLRDAVQEALDRLETTGH